MVTFEQLMKAFGVVTVMNACIYQLKDDKSYTGSSCGHKAAGGALSKADWEFSGEVLDTLKIANITQEGPTKEIKGGQYANSLIKYGKTTRCEMQDALGKASTLVRFFGAEYDETTQKTYKYTDTVVGDGSTTTFYVMKGLIPSDKIASATWTSTTGTVNSKEAATAGLEGYVKITLSEAPANETEVTITCEFTIGTAKEGTRVSITDKFPGPFAIEGTTFFIDQKTGDKVPVFIFIPQFAPDAILNLTQDMEGDAAVFDLNGTVNTTKISDGSSEREIFYEIRKESFFGTHD